MDGSLEHRLSAIEQRLTLLEARLAGASTAQPGPAVQTAPAATTAPPRGHSVQRPQPAAVKRVPHAEEKPGSWLGLIGIVCFVLAAGFIIKLSIESGWLTPERQVGLAALLGLSLIGAGFALQRSDRDYAALLPAAGVVVLYLTAFASYRYYALVSFEVALSLSAMVSVICIWLYAELKHDVYAVTAAVGSYIAPAVLGLNTAGEFTLYYFVTCSLGFAVISIWVRSRTLSLVASYMAILMTGLVGMGIQDSVLVAVILALHFVIYSVGTYLHSQHTGQLMTQDEAWGFFPVLLIFYGCEYYHINKLSPELAPWISLAFAGLIIGLYLAAQSWKKADTPMHSRPMVTAFATVVAFHAIYLELMPDSAQPWLLVALMLALAFGRFDFSSDKATQAYKFPLAALALVAAIEYISMLAHLCSGLRAEAWLPVSLASFAAIWLALALGPRRMGQRNEYGLTLLAAAHMLAIMAFYRLTKDIGSLAVSASWLLYAVAVIGFAFKRRDEIMAKSALFVLSFAAAKALLYDASSAPTVVRILCLLLTGAVLYGSGFLMRKIADWKKA